MASTHVYTDKIQIQYNAKGGLYDTSYNWPVNRQKNEQTETNLRGFGDLCGKEDNPMYFKAKYL